MLQRIGNAQRNYLAIPKHLEPRPAAIGGGTLLAASSATANGSLAQEILERSSLREIRDSKDQASNKDTYLALEAIDTYALTTTEDQLDSIRGDLEEEYFVMPDVALELPTTMASRPARSRLTSNYDWLPLTGIPQARKALDGSGVTVVVLDTGIDAGHREFRKRRIDFHYVPLDHRTKPRKVRGFDTNGHGTHVCGILAGERIGIAPNVDLHVAAVIESETVKTTLFRIVRAFNALTREGVLNRDTPTILSMSLGFDEEQIEDKHLEMAALSFRNYLTRFSENGTLVIAAIGNDGRKGEGAVRFPGAFPEVLSVGAVNDQNQIADFSSWGPSPIRGEEPVPHIAGLGVDRLSSLERNVRNQSIYLELSGTSMAAPYVAGIAALYAQADPQLSPEDIRRLLIHTAIPPTSQESRYGAGLARFDST